MSESTPIQLPFIKKDAVVSVLLMTGTIQDIQSILHYLLDGMTEPDVQAIGEKITGKTPLSQKEHAIVTLTRLLKIISESAEQNNQVEYKELSDVISSGLS